MRAKMAADKKDASVTPTHNQNKENSSTDTEYWSADIDEKLWIENLMKISQ